MMGQRLRRLRSLAYRRGLVQSRQAGELLVSPSLHRGGFAVNAVRLAMREL